MGGDNSGLYSRHGYVTLTAVPFQGFPATIDTPVIDGVTKLGVAAIMQAESGLIVRAVAAIIDDLAGSDLINALSTVGVLYLVQPDPLPGTFFRARALLDTTDDDISQGSVGATLMGTVNRNELFNGALWDRARNNQQTTPLASAVRTATTNSADQINHNGRGVHVIINVTVAPGAQTLTPIIQGFDVASGLYYDILTGTAISATGTTVLKVYPGINGLAGAAAPDIVSRTWRVRVVHSAGGIWIYSVGANVIV